MKKAIASIVETVKIIINCIIAPLYFIKLLVSESVIPGVNQNGDRVLHRSYHYFSVFYKFNREGLAFLVWGAIAIIILSIALSVLSLRFEDKKALKIASHIVFVISVALFSVLFFIAWNIRYMY